MMNDKTKFVILSFFNLSLVIRDFMGTVLFSFFAENNFIFYNPPILKLTHENDQ
jgi:hypothetical protein